MALGSRFRSDEKTSVEEKSFHVGATPSTCVLHARQAMAIDERRADFRPEIWLDTNDDRTLEQRWFAGHMPMLAAHTAMTAWQIVRFTGSSTRQNHKA